METETTAPAPAAPQNGIQNGNSELKSVFETSKNSIHKQKLESPKIKAGRKAYPRDENGNKIRPGDPRFAAANSKMQAEGPKTTSNPQVTEQPPEPPPKIAEYLIDPIIAISNIPANKHQITELALNRQEAAACANAIQNIIDAFIPDLSKMSPKTAAILSSGLVFGSIAVSKLQILGQVQYERARARANEQQNNGVQETEVIKTGEGVKRPARELFKN